MENGVHLKCVSRELRLGMLGITEDCTKINYLHHSMNIDYHNYFSYEHLYILFFIAFLFDFIILTTILSIIQNAEINFKIN